MTGLRLKIVPGLLHRQALHAYKPLINIADGDSTIQTCLGVCLCSIVDTIQWFYSILETASLDLG